MAQAPQPPSDTLISVILVTQNDQDIAQSVIRELNDLLKNSYNFFEILIVDNGSNDGSVDNIKNLQQELPNIRLLVLSRRYDQEIAFAAALDNCLGDFVVIMDMYCDPPALIPVLLLKAQAGFDVVIADRKDRSDNTWVEKMFAQLFYKIYGNLSGFYFSPNASYFRVLSRRALNSVIQIKNKSRYLKYFNAMVGFKQTHIVYDRVYRKNKNQHKAGFVHSLIKALDVIISNTVLPLRLVSVFGVLASFLNLFFLVYVFVISVIKDHIAEGWISSSVMSASMFFLLFLFLSVISEYIARILVESKDQPLYFIADEFNSASFSSSTQATPSQKINVV